MMSYVFKSDRRTVLKTGALATALAPAMMVAPKICFAQSAPTTRSTDTLIVVFLRGAMDGLSAVVPFTEAEYFAKRVTTQVAKPDAASAPSIALNNQFALHPSLAPLKAVYDAGELAIVHATGLARASRSHFDAQDFMERAWNEKGGVYSGWLNRHLQATALAQQNTFRAVAVGRSVQKSLTGSAPAVGLASIASFGLQSTNARESEMASTLQGLFDSQALIDTSALRALNAEAELARFNLGAIGVDPSASYPNTTFGNQMRDLARLIKGNIGVEAATIDLGGWDTHNNQVNLIGNLFDQLARTLVAFRNDLGSARMKNVSVVTMTEFGRRFQENGNVGTDHGYASAMFLMGGNTAGGQVFTAWPGLGANQLQAGDLRVTTDYRAVLSELLLKRANAPDLSGVFPGYLGGPTEGLYRQRA
jgi:uncharacterized protein (DUF1501 family)